jgi:pimeloyl-ACP methyl ester carboxylesterase
MPFPYLGETKVLNNFTRQNAPGRFIQLSDGMTHYEYSGGDEESTVILIPGFSVPFFIYDPTYLGLSRSGHSVLRYDLYGRGWSDRPNVQYDINLFVKQLGELIDKLEIKRVNLIGLSMGGPIAAAYAMKFPNTVRSLSLIDPVGGRPLDLPVLLKLVKIPVLGEFIIGLVGNPGMLKSIAADFYHSELARPFFDAYKVQLEYRGFKRAILSTLRNHLLGEFLDVYRSVERMKIPVLLIWGCEDATVPFEQHKLLREIFRDAQFHAIDSSGHIPQYEQPDIVNPILISFLNDPKTA